MCVRAPSVPGESKRKREEREVEREERERGGRKNPERRKKLALSFTIATFSRPPPTSSLPPSASFPSSFLLLSYKKMTVAGLTVVGPRIAAAVLLSTALYALVPQLSHSEAPATTARYAADGVYRARHPFQSTDRTGERERSFCSSSVSFACVFEQSGRKKGAGRGALAWARGGHHSFPKVGPAKQFRRPSPVMPALACFVPGHLRSRKLCERDQIFCRGP